MITPSRKLRVVVVGSGYRLAMTSYALARKLGPDNIAIVAVDTGHGDSSQPVITLADMRLFNASLGVDEKAFLSACGADIHLGWMLRRTDSPCAMMFANGRYGVPINNTPFHQLYRIYQTHSPGVSLDEFSLASSLAKAGKFSSPSSRKDSIFSTLDYGYSFSPAACERFFKRLALHSNVTFIKSNDIVVAACEKGVDKIVTKTGQILEADLFIDCSNDGSLVAKVDATVNHITGNHVTENHSPIDCRTILPFRHCTTSSEKNHADDDSLYSNWQQTQSGFQTTTTHGGCISTEQVDFRLPESPSPDQGADCKQDTGFTHASALASSWNGNCVALGSAYAQLPNVLPGTHPLFLKQLLQLLGIWFGQKNCSAVAEAFSQASAEALASVIDVINIQLHAHPALSATVDLTEVNRSRIDLFCGSGTLPLTENAIVAEQQWIALLMGLGFQQQANTLGTGAQTLTSAVDQLDPLRQHIQKITESAGDYSEWIKQVRART